MPEEPALLGQRQADPDALRDRPERVECRPPVGLAARRGPQRPEQATQPGCSDADRRRLGIGVHVGQEAVSRQRLDGAPVPAAPQREGGVHHGQAGAEQQHGRLGIDAVQRARLPRRAPVQGAQVQPAVRHLQFRTCEIAQGQHGRARVQLASAAQDETDVLVSDRRSHHVRRHREQDDAGSRAGPRLRQKRLQVGAVSRAADELVRAGAAPPHEVIGILRQRAHAPGGHVEHMTRLRRSVGEPARKRAAPLDERDAQGPARLAQQLHGHQRAARAAPYDRDVGRSHGGEGSHSSHIRGRPDCGCAGRSSASGRAGARCSGRSVACRTPPHPSCRRERTSHTPGVHR